MGHFLRVLSPTPRPVDGSLMAAGGPLNWGTDLVGGLVDRSSIAFGNREAGLFKNLDSVYAGC